MTSDQLKKVRSGWHMSQSEFADLLGASLRTYQEWEQGRAGVPTHVAKHVETIGNLKKIYTHWDKIAQAIVSAGGTALTGESLIAAINSADDLADKHELLWGKLFPALKRDEEES